MKLEVRRKSTSSNRSCYFSSQNETRFEPLHDNIKMDKIAKKTDVCWRLMFELSTAIEKVDIKVILMPAKV